MLQVNQLAYEETAERVTPLCLACFCGKPENFEVIRYLVEQGADLEIGEEDQKRTCLMAALLSKAKDQMKTVRYLLEKGANVNGKSRKGWKTVCCT